MTQPQNGEGDRERGKNLRLLFMLCQDLNSYGSCEPDTFFERVGTLTGASQAVKAWLRYFRVRTGTPRAERRGAKQALSFSVALKKIGNGFILNGFTVNGRGVRYQSREA